MPILMKRKFTNLMILFSNDVRLVLLYLKFGLQQR